MTTTWNISMVLEPKKDKINKVSDKLSETFDCPVEKEGNRLFLDCIMQGGYNFNRELPEELSNELKNELAFGELFMKEIEPASNPFPADTYADLVKRIRRDRSIELFEEVF